MTVERSKRRCSFLTLIFIAVNEYRVDKLYKQYQPIMSLSILIDLKEIKYIFLVLNIFKSFHLDIFLCYISYIFLDIVLCF